MSVWLNPTCLPVDVGDVDEANSAVLALAHDECILDTTKAASYHVRSHHTQIGYQFNRPTSGRMSLGLAQNSTTPLSFAVRKPPGRIQRGRASSVTILLSRALSATGSAEKHSELVSRKWGGPFQSSCGGVSLATRQRSRPLSALQGD